VNTYIPLPASPHSRQPVWTLVRAFLLCGLALCNPAAIHANDLAGHARALKTQLIEKVLPYWYDTAQDTEAGGYLLADDLRGRGTATEKQIVGQTRMIWGFSHAHLKGFSDQNRNYLRAAKQGYRFLLAHFLDPENGGYYWRTDLAGKVTGDRKLLYGESFVIYALVEYYRASGDHEALRHAMDLYAVLQKRAHDPKHGGWIEHFTRDWQPVLKPDPQGEVEVPGYKSANAHLHFMEALTELYDVTLDKAVKESLQEALRINATWFYPKDPGQSAFHRQLNWQPVTDPTSAGLSYGHNVEFAWLMIRAQQVLGQPPAWAHFDAHLQHALKYGYDHERGGLYNRGADNQPATQTDKVWWVEAEMLAALTDALKHESNPAYSEALDKLLHFINAYQINPSDGIWLDTVTAEGRRKATGKAHSWKANYHDVRAIVKFTEAFGTQPKH
jgi:mannose/cellobiose epimerase-like protein (N-acyl-D-glucosamine 2-epimerase family)